MSGPSDDSIKKTREIVFGGEGDVKRLERIRQNRLGVNRELQAINRRLQASLKRGEDAEVRKESLAEAERLRKEFNALSLEIKKIERMASLNK
jgi:hypothetical protein